MKRKSKMICTLALTILLAASAFLMLLQGEETEVEAMQSSTTDRSGYCWIDNRDPNPKVQYNYIDIHSTGTKISSWDKYSYYSTYPTYYYGYEKVTLPFAFPFYGKYNTEAYIGTKGVLGFDNCISCSYFTSWTYSYNIPHATYTPDDTINVYSGYGMGVPNSFGGVYYQSGTDGGRQYFIVQWYRVSIYYYYGERYKSTSYTLDFEVILYDDGTILCQYKDTTTSYSSSYSTGDGALAGIEAPDGSHGLQYSRDSRGALPAGRAIMYKQFGTEISDITFSQRYGPDENILPAQAGEGEPHWVSANVWVESKVGDLKNIDMVIGPGTGEENIIFRYDFATESFQELNDVNRMTILDADRSYISYSTSTPNNDLTVMFFFDFNLNWLRISLIDVELRVEGSGVRPSTVLVKDAFRVETRMAMEGNITATDFKGRELQRGDWVKGGDNIVFTGVTRRYADPSIIQAPPDTVMIGVEDETGTKYIGETPDLMDVKVPVPEHYSNIEYGLTFINVPDRNDVSDTYYKNYRLFLQIDSDKPGLPGELVIRPDSFEDQSLLYDDDPEVYLSWKDAVDQSSGVTMYHISVNMDREEAYASEARIIDVPKGTLTALIDGLEEGVNTIYIWAEDAVGNEGNSIFIDVTIDLSPVYFSDFYPITGEWISTLRPRCSMVIHDDLTGVDPLTIEYEISTTGEVGLVGEWNAISEPYATSDELRVVVEGWFKNGKDNWIHFRAKDMAGNGYVESESYNVWVDAKSPTYKLLSHTEDEYQNNPLQEVKVQILDEQSWVDASSIEYRITTQGQTKWSLWLPYKDALDGPNPVVTLREHFRRGDDNYVQVRANDLAGNPISTSKAFNIRINTYPVIVVVSPSPGDQLFEGDMIVFDAGDSYDPDGDKLSITWSKSTPNGTESLGESEQVTAKLPAGEYTITVVVRDRVDNQVQMTFPITVEKKVIPPEEDNDLDGDGIPDWWEEKYQTDPEAKDAQLDPDGDGFTNLQEFQNNTNPKNGISRPPTPPPLGDDGTLDLFSVDAWPLWVFLVVVVMVVVLTMLVMKSKKDRQVKRIQTVRNMRKIMPSVSWDQITTTAYLAPMMGMGLPASSGPILPSGSPGLDYVNEALPPAAEAGE
ncbi:MAG: hypothetical protein ACMUFK_00460 [Thermoplasmatota archaeon]